MPRPRVPDRRERILDAAEELVLAQGFDHMSVASVAARAGIGKGAVYLEFAGKRDVLDALLLRGNRRMADRVRRELETTLVSAMPAGRLREHCWMIR